MAELWPGDVISLLAQLVRIPSVNPMGREDLRAQYPRMEGALTDYLWSLLELPGVERTLQRVTDGRHNLIAHLRSEQSQRTMLWDVHQDTVPADGMTIGPFDAVIERDRLYGRGACDVKGSMAAMLWAFRRLAEERPAGAASVVLVLTVDEEYTHTGSSALAESWPVPVVDLAIVAEPTLLDLITTHKGAVRWRIVARGVASHSARPELGDNAIYRAGRVLAELDRHARQLRNRAPHAVLGAPSLSVGVIGGGTAANIVPDRCVMELDRRVIPGEQPAAARQEVIDVLRSRLDAGDFASLDFEEPWVRMPALGETVGPETLARLGDVVQRVTGARPSVGGVPFGTDAGPLGQSGMPCVVFGPGDIAQAHTKDEWVALNQVRAAAECYFEFANALG